MGQFSWMYADTRNTENLYICQPAYVICPDGSVIKEESYGGYGIFGGHDIFELVADWNKDIDIISRIEFPERRNYSQDREGDEFYHKAQVRYKTAVTRAKDFQAGESEEFMASKYGKDWKREIGINIAGYEWKCLSIPYPIKICKNEPVMASYDDYPPSLDDRNQGFSKVNISINQVEKRMANLTRTAARNLSEHGNVVMALETIGSDVIKTELKLFERESKLWLLETKRDVPVKLKILNKEEEKLFLKDEEMAVVNEDQIPPDELIGYKDLPPQNMERTKDQVLPNKM